MVIKVSVPDRFQFKMVPTFKNMMMLKQGDVHYIGGSDVLPAPLGAEEEARAIAGLGTGNDQFAKSQLIEHNLRLVVYIANSYNPEKNIKLATYASRCIENEILMYLRRNSKTKAEVSIDEPLNVDWDGNELLLSDILGTEEDIIYRDLEEEVEKSMLNKAIGKLSERERIIVDLRYGLSSMDGEEKTQKEVADLLGISQSYISRLEKKIMKRLKKELVKNS